MLRITNVIQIEMRTKVKIERRKARLGMMKPGECYEWRMLTGKSEK